MPIYANLVLLHALLARQRIQLVPVALHQTILVHPRVLLFAPMELILMMEIGNVKPALHPALGAQAVIPRVQSAQPQNF